MDAKWNNIVDNTMVRIGMVVVGFGAWLAIGYGLLAAYEGGVAARVLPAPPGFCRRKNRAEPLHFRRFRAFNSGLLPQS